MDPKDEILLYVRGRYLCSMDAMWRTLRYHTYPSPTPTVYIIKVKLPEVTNYFSSRNELTDIQAYFQRPAQLHPLLYTEFHNRYIIKRTLSNLFKRKYTENTD